MGKIGTSYLVPHPPIIVAEVGQGEERKAQKTIDAMKEYRWTSLLRNRRF